MNRRHALNSALALGTLGLGLPRWAVASSAFPSGVIRLVVPFEAGGAADVYARLIATGLSEALGRTAVIDNKPGASTMLGSSLVANAPADGLTLLFTTSSLVQTPVLQKKPAFIASKAFAGLTMVARAPHVLVATQASGLRSLSDMLDALKQGRFDGSVGNHGIGTIGDLYLKKLARQTSQNLVSVPYKGDAGISKGLLSSEIKVAFLSVLASINLTQQGAVRPIAVIGAQRNDFLADTPTFAEQGFAGYDAMGWFAMMAPKAVPAPTLALLSAALKTTLSSNAAKDTLGKAGLTPTWTSPQGMDEVVLNDEKTWAALIHELNIEKN